MRSQLLLQIPLSLQLVQLLNGWAWKANRSTTALEFLHARCVMVSSSKDKMWQL